MTLLRLMRLPQALSPASEVKFTAAAPVPFPVPADPAAPAKAEAVPPPPLQQSVASPVPILADAEPAPMPVRNGTSKTAPAPEPLLLAEDPPLPLLPDEEPTLTLSPIGDIPPMLTDEDESDLADEDDDLDSMTVPLPGDDDLDILMPEADALPSLLVTSADQHTETEDFMQVQQVAREAPTAPAAPPAMVPTQGDNDPPELIQLQKQWQEVINRMGSRAPSGVALVRDAKPMALHGQTFTLEFTSRFFVDKLAKNEKGRTTIEDVINKTLDVAPETYKIKCVMQGEGISANGPAKKISMPSPAPLAGAPQQDSALLDEVIAVFGGRVLDDPDAKG